MSQIIIPQKTVEMIDGLEFTCTPFPAWHALGLLPQLQALGPQFGFAGDGPAVSPNPTIVQATILELLKQTSVMISDAEDKPARRIELTSKEKFNQVFTGRLPTLFKVVAFANKVNFGNFGDGSESEPVDPQLPAL